MGLVSGERDRMYQSTVNMYQDLWMIKEESLKPRALVVPVIWW